MCTKIGYWRETIDTKSQYPFPMPHMITLDQQDISDRTIAVLEKYGKSISCNGYSPCRLCCDHKNNGSSEYTISYKEEKYVIPSGYFHYVNDHNVKIDDRLVDIVHYYTNKGAAKHYPCVRIGYWRDTLDGENYHRNRDYPFPIPCEEILNQTDLIKITIELLSEYGSMNYYDGYSPCRLCDNEENGNGEYVITYDGTRYVIPTGYFHYLSEHNVKMDDKLVEIVEYYRGVHLQNIEKKEQRDHQYVYHINYNPSSSFSSSSLSSSNQLDIVKKAAVVLHTHAIVDSNERNLICALCSRDLGSLQYSITYNGIVYVIPSGYLHYVTDHNVKMDDMLVEIVDYYNQMF